MRLTQYKVLRQCKKGTQGLVGGKGRIICERLRIYSRVHQMSHHLQANLLEHHKLYANTSAFKGHLHPNKFVLIQNKSRFIIAQVLSILVMICQGCSVQCSPVRLHCHVPQSVIVNGAAALLDNVLVGFALLPQPNITLQASFSLWALPVQNDLRHSSVNAWITHLHVRLRKLVQLCGIEHMHDRE